MYKLTADWGDGTVLWEREIENCEMPGAVLVVVKELEGLELMKPSDLAAVLRSRAEIVVELRGEGEEEESH